MALRVLITVLCGVGLYVALFMLNKSKRAERGELHERSVVETPRARLFGGVPNAALGGLFYPAVAIAIWLVDRPWELAVVLLFCGVASITSLVLAYSLLFITRMPCVYCWSAHAINWALTLCVVLLYVSAF